MQLFVQKIETKNNRNSFIDSICIWNSIVFTVWQFEKKEYRNMDSNFTSMALFLYFCFALNTTIAAQKKGYLVSEFPDIACNDPSNVKFECSDSLDYKMTNLSSILPSNVTSVLAKNRKIIPMLFPFLSSNECSKVAKKYFCESA